MFVLETNLVRSVDAIDAYFSWLRRAPALIQNVETQKQIDSAGQSVFGKFVAIKNSTSSIDPLTAALIEIMIAWRNRSVHFLADNQASEEAWNTVKSRKDEMYSRFNGLTLEPLQRGFQHNDPPSFKETASFIRATHEAVRQFDEFYIRQLDTVAFLPELIWHAVNLNLDDDVPAMRRKRVQSIWGKDSSERGNRVLSFLKNCGLSEQSGDPSATFSDELISEVSTYSFREVISYMESRRR